MWHGIKQFACPDPQSVLNAENKKCAVFHNLENARNIAKNGDRDKDIKKTADPVTFIANLYDVKDFLFHDMSFLKLRYTLLKHENRDLTKCMSFHILIEE